MSKFNTLDKGFDLKYEVLKLSSIKTSGGGIVEGREYSPSIKIKASTVVQVNDEELGLTDKEDTIEFSVACQDKKQVAELNTHLRQLQNNGIPLTISGGLPQKYSSDGVYHVKAYETPEQLLTNVKALLGNRKTK
jgi:hypothetical protein